MLTHLLPNFEFWFSTRVMLVIALFLMGGCKEPVSEPDASQVIKLSWAQMIPEGFTANEILRRYDVGGLAGDDPVRHNAVKNMREEWQSAPVDESLDGQLVALSGYVVPFDDGALKFSEFLLVPFAGACIHVPPPPSNQIVSVRFPSRIYIEDLDEPYRVIGRLRTKNSSSELASSGYRLEASIVEPYSVK